MKAPMLDIWVYLAASPLLGLTITLLAYLLAMALHRRCRMHPVTKPVLIAAAVLVPLLLLSEPTLEGLQKLYQTGRPSLGLFNDDAGGFLPIADAPHTPPRWREAGGRSQRGAGPGPLRGGLRPAGGC